MNKHGEITAKIAKKLEFERCVVYYDHGDSSNDKVGKIAVWCGEKERPDRNTELSQIDIAIVEKDSSKEYKAIALVEIEETSDRPKTLIGDIFGFLLGEHIDFRGNLLKVGDYTTLVVVGISKSKDNHEMRRLYIEKQTNQLKNSLSTGNAMIGQVMVIVYQDKDNMLKNLPSDLHSLVTHSAK